MLRTGRKMQTFLKSRKQHKFLLEEIESRNDIFGPDSGNIMEIIVSFVEMIDVSLL